MKAFEKEDVRFVEIVLEANQRDTAIAELKRKRTLLFWAAMLATLAAILSIFAEHPQGAVYFGAAFSWGMVWKFESDLRLLLAVRALKKL